METGNTVAGSENTAKGRSHGRNIGKGAVHRRNTREGDV